MAVSPDSPSPVESSSAEAGSAAETAAEQAIRERAIQDGYVRRSKIVMLVMLVLALIFITLVLSPPVILKSAKATERTEALNNMRQIGTALIEFDADYGSFPDAATIPEVIRLTGTTLPLGDGSSNQLFRQLIATGVKSERPFYAKGKGIRRPDDVIFPPAKALAPGECGFSYVAGLSSSGVVDKPVVMAPMIRGTDRFDPNVFYDKAVVLFLDNSVTPITINAAGEAVGARGFRGNLFDPANPVWAGKKPDLKWPE